MRDTPTERIAPRDAIPLWRFEAVARRLFEKTTGHADMPYAAKWTEPVEGFRKVSVTYLRDARLWEVAETVSIDRLPTVSFEGWLFNRSILTIPPKKDQRLPSRWELHRVLTDEGTEAFRTSGGIADAELREAAGDAPPLPVLPETPVTGHVTIYSYVEDHTRPEDLARHAAYYTHYRLTTLPDLAAACERSPSSVEQFPFAGLLDYAKARRLGELTLSRLNAEREVEVYRMFPS